MPLTKHGYNCDNCGRRCRVFSTRGKRRKHKCGNCGLIFRDPKNHVGTMRPGDGKWPVDLKNSATVPTEWGKIHSVYGTR